MNEKNTEIVRKQITDWLGNMLFSHYLTVDLPFNRKYYNEEQSVNFLKIIVKRFEKELVGRHWNKKPVHFVGFMEQGEHKVFHWHLLCCAFQYTDVEMENAVIKTINYMKLDKKTVHVKPIEHTRYILDDYNVKELKSDDKFHINSDHIFFCNTLFYL